ncbi:MAG: ferric reductase-like transmembrane domain-containing protein, partial [Candidatus Nomurabacteria bacterium]|nr:ferric reductase-like transmembrane domain-containing protein [Candidatus Nomurabacteria bacterium]
MPTSSQLFLHKFRNSWKWILGTILILPLLRWLFLIPIDSRFSTFALVAKALGQVTGIVGTLLFSFSLILSFRNRFIEIIFGGLDKLYNIHHKAGMYGLFLLLLHPILLSLPRLMYSVEDAMTFFIPFQTSTAVDFGIFSILAFILLIGITLFGVIFSYQALKKFHIFLGLAFLLGAIHGFMIPSDIQNDTFIRVWVLGSALLGLLSYIIYSLLKKFTVRKKIYSVTSVKKIEGGITEIFLTSNDGGINHLPGQFAFLSFINSKVVTDEVHPFTISSWENDGNIIISAKALGDFTNLLPNVEIGTLVEVEGPYGEFNYGYNGLKQVWIAGGVGVTPFASFVEHILKQKELLYDIDFFYSVRTEDDLAFDGLFKKVAKHFPSFKYHPMPSDTDGYITGPIVAEKVPGIIVR